MTTAEKNELKICEVGPFPHATTLTHNLRLPVDPRGGSSLWNVDSPNRKGSTAAGLGTLKKPLKVAFRVLFVLCRGHPLDARHPVEGPSRPET